MPSTLVLLSLLSIPLLQVAGQTSYANEFVDPDFIVAGDFPANSVSAQRTIANWATRFAAQGPWSVTSKSATPPSGTKNDYMSWAPYWWPDCSEAGNTTALSETEIWTQCRYVRRDGQFNPDVRGVDDVGNFQTMSDAVLYSALAWSFDKTSLFGQNAVRYIRTWFLDEATRMNPHLNYAQMIRGTNGREGSPTGVLDLKGMAKVASAILILKKAECPEWTSAIEDQMVAWSREYITWLETSELALDEGNSENNHGSFYFNQLAALKLIVDDIPGAINVTRTYFAKQFLFQIDANGEQPLEAARTRPYHYRAYNIAAMITSARIEKYADPTSTVWNRTGSQGASIKTALDYAMTHQASESGESSYAAELYPNVAAVASIYGDANGDYLQYLRAADSEFFEEPYFLWNNGAWASSVGPTATGRTRTATSTSSKKSQSTSSNSNVADGAGVSSVSLSSVSALFAVIVPLLLPIML